MPPTFKLSNFETLSQQEEEEEQSCSLVGPRFAAAENAKTRISIFFNKRGNIISYRSFGSENLNFCFLVKM